MENLLDKVPACIFSFTDEGKLLFVNDPLCEILQFSKGELEQKGVEVIFTVASRIFYNTHFFPLLKMQGHAEEIFITLRSRSKAEVPVIINARRNVKEEGAENIIVCIPVYNRRKYEDELLAAKRQAEEALQKNSELIRIEEELQSHAEHLDKKLVQLQQRNEELYQINEIFTHELQEPLRKILMYSDIMQQQAKEGKTATALSSAQKIHTFSHQLRKVVLTLQEYGRLDAGNNKIVPAYLNQALRSAVQKVQAAYSDLFLHSENKPEIHSEDMPVIEGYPDQLTLLFFHLLENSVKFRKPDRSLKINIHCTEIQQNSFKFTKEKYKYEDVVKIEFSDNGSGFDKKYEDYVFQMLKKLDRVSEGLGAGLALCKKIVENHCGSISVNTNPGEGTTFTILLPKEQSNKPHPRPLSTSGEE